MKCRNSSTLSSLVSTPADFEPIRRLVGHGGLSSSLTSCHNRLAAQSCKFCQHGEAESRRTTLRGVWSRLDVGGYDYYNTDIRSLWALGALLFWNGLNFSCFLCYHYIHIINKETWTESMWRFTCPSCAAYCYTFFIQGKLKKTLMSAQYKLVKTSLSPFIQSWEPSLTQVSSIVNSW